MSNGIALITGATSGIGEAVALKLAMKGYDLIITGRRRSRLSTLASSIEKDYKVRTLPLVFDVCSLVEVEKHLSNLPANWSNIDILVNNAGLAVGLNPIDKGIIEDWERMIKHSYLLPTRKPLPTISTTLRKSVRM